MRLQEYARRIEAILENPSRSDWLEDVLIALWAEIAAHKDQAPTWELFIQLLTAAWSGRPVVFDESWMAMTRRPDSTEFETRQPLDDFAFLEGTILFQIADLRRMRDAGYFERDANKLFLGVQSPTDYSWFNFWPEDYLECAISGVTDLAHGEDKELEPPTWRDLAVMLIMGQIYE